MPLLDNLFGPQVDKFQRSLALTTQRHAALTANMANIDTPGYKRRDVDFNLHLDDAMSRANEKFAQLTGDSAGQADESNLRLDGNSVDLEREVMALSETELRYQALTDMTASYFAGLKNVIREGK